VRELKMRGVAKPQIGIILGTGLGRLAKQIKQAVKIPFDACPYFPKATSIGHSGHIVFGKLHGKRVIAMEGRFHLFEGYTPQEVTFPVYVFKALGVKSLILSNAAGGLNPAFKLADIMIITDHVNFMGTGPLEGPNDERLGPRFPDMCQPYNPSLVELAKKEALKEKIILREGTYISVRGPHLETRAEYRVLRMMGADAVGMSTVPEVIAAQHVGLSTVAFSCITDMGLADALEPVDIDRILRVAAQTEPKLTRIVTRMVARL
jgi:purine-nucleoside phosphorylase